MSGGNAGFKPVEPELLLKVDLWKQALEMQKHFNGITMQIRNFALTLLVAVLGAAAVALREGGTVSLFGFDASLASVLLIAGLVGWGGFYVMDRHWYHRFLKAAVKHAEKIEEALKDEIPIGLTTAISEESGWKLGREEAGAAGRKVGSTDRIDGFYGAIAALLVILALTSCNSGTVESPAPEPLTVRILEWPELAGADVEATEPPIESP